MLLFSGLTYDMKSLIVKDSPNRIQIIDGLRGLSILLMVAYHFGYDLAHLCRGFSTAYPQPRS